MRNEEIQLNRSRRRFFRTSSLMLGAALLPSSTLFSKAPLYRAKLGSSISMLISFRGKTVGVKFTTVDNSYVIGTIRTLKGKKLEHFYIQGPSGKEKSSSGKKTSVKMQKGISGAVMVNPQKGTFTTSVKGVKLSRVKFNDSNNDDIPSGQGFFSWLGDKIADAARGIAAGITWCLDGAGTWWLSGGGSIDVSGGNIEYKSNSGSFMSEAGLEEQPGVWY